MIDTQNADVRLALTNYLNGEMYARRFNHRAVAIVSEVARVLTPWVIARERGVSDALAEENAILRRAVKSIGATLDATREDYAASQTALAEALRLAPSTPTPESPDHA